MYRIDFQALARQLLPSLLRRPRMLAYVEALTAPTRELYAQLLSYSAQARIELSYNGQTIMLEKALNDVFDAGLRRIRIDATTIEQTPVYLNWKVEQQPEKYFHNKADETPPRYLRDGATYSNPVAFTVFCPLAMLPATSPEAQILKARLESFIKKYKLVGTVHRTIYR